MPLHSYFVSSTFSFVRSTPQVAEMAFAMRSSTARVAMRNGAFKAAPVSRRVMLVAPRASAVSEIVSPGL